MFLRGNSWIAPAMFTTHFFALVTALAISASIVPVIMHLDFKRETPSYPDFLTGEKGEFGHGLFLLCQC